MGLLLLLFPRIVFVLCLMLWIMMVSSGYTDGLSGFFATYVMIVGLPMLICRIVSFFLGLEFQSPILHAFVRKTCKWATILAVITGLILPQIDGSANQKSLNITRKHISAQIKDQVHKKRHRKILYDKLNKAKTTDEMYKIRDEDMGELIDIEFKEFLDTGQVKDN